MDLTTCKPVGTPVQVGTFREGANRVNFAPLDITGAAGGTVVMFSSLGNRLKDAGGAIKNCDGSEMLGEQFSTLFNSDGGEFVVPST